MAYSFQTFTLNQVLTASQMNQVEVNVRDHTHGTAGVVTIDTAGFTAAAVDQAAIGASAVGQGELKTTTGEVSTVSTNATPLTLAGGEYGFFPQVRHSAGGGAGAALFGGINTTTASNSTSFVTIILINANSSGTAYGQQRYVQASPPYDLGNGDIPLFVFLAVRPDGTVVHGYLAEDPPWANNGPTDIRADYFRGGKAYQKIRAPILFTAESFIKAPESEQRILLSQRLAQPMVEVEITQQIKQADMPLIPHPFTSTDLADLTIVLVDPTSNLCAGLRELCRENDGSESVLSLFHSRSILIDNTAMPGVFVPPDVMPVKARWKITA